MAFKIISYTGAFAGALAYVLTESILLGAGISFGAITIAGLFFTAGNYYSGIIEDMERRSKKEEETKQFEEYQFYKIVNGK